VNHDLVSGVPMQMTITMIMAMSVGKKFR